MNEDKLLSNIRRWALFIGTGGVAALQVMKLDMFTYPDKWEVILAQIFSIITLICVFLGGPEIIRIIQEGREVITSLKNQKQEEERKTKKVIKKIEDGDDN